MQALPPPGGPPAGWYPDPGGYGLRYFDGWQWGPYAYGAPAPAATPVERGPHPTLPLWAALGALVVLALSLVVQHTVARLLDDADLPILATAGIGIVLAYGPSLAWAWHVLGRMGGGIGRLGWKFRWVDAGWGPLTWLGSVIAEVTVVLVATRLFDVPFESNVGTTDDDVTAAYVTAMILSACVAAPLVEELIFRGVVLRGLVGRIGVIAAVPVQGVLFGLAHIDPIDRGWGNIGLVLALSTVGCGLGLVTVLTRRIGAAIVAHTLLNGFVLTMVLTGAADDVNRDVNRLVALLPFV